MDQVTALMSQLGIQIEGLGTDVMKLDERLRVLEARVQNTRAVALELIRALDRRP